MTRKENILKFLGIYCIFSSVFNIYECVGFNCHLPEGCQLEKIYFGNTLNFNEKTNSKYLAMVCDVPNQQFGFKFKEPTPLKAQNNSCDMNIDENNSTYHFQTTIIRWRSSELGILDKTLNLTNALRYFKYFLHYVILTFHNFKGFDLKIFEDGFDSNQHSYLSNMAFIGIRLDFYHNRKKINSCQEIIDLKLKPIKSIFQISGDTRAGKNRIFELKDVEYTSKICPLVFENANIYRLILSNLVDSFYKKSLLTFEELNYTSLNSDIKYIQLQNVLNIDINLNLLNPLVFNKTLYFAVFSEYEVNSISEEVFKVFKNLLSIALNPILFKKINHKQGINWIRQINSGVNVNISNFKVREIQKATPKQLLMVSLVYLNKRISKLFPEEDFCLYVDFPFNQLVIFYDNIASSFEKKTGLWIIDNDRITCTYLWLIQHYGYYYRLFTYWNTKDAENMLKVINSTAFKSISKCEFEKMKRLCDKSSYQLRNDWDESEFLILNKKLETAFKISLYLVSFLGLFTNSIVIVVILFKDNSDLFKEFKQYSYLCLNSVFCLLISLIEILSWMSECFYPFEVFCPEIRKLAGIQFFKIIFKECFVTMFRFMCSFSYVAFALNRISLIGKDHGKIVTFMSEVGFKKYIICAIFTSSVLSWIKFFKYEVNYFYPDANYPLSNEMNVISSESIQFNDFYFTYNSISDIFNYLVFVAICVTIDICMVVQLRRTLSEKAKKSESMSQKQNQAKKAEYEEAVNKAIRMVVLNGAIGFLFKLPVSIIPVINMAAQFYYKNAISLAVNPGFNEFYLMLYNTRLNDLLRDFSDLLYTLSLSIQMFMYNRFDKKFAIGFDRVKEKALTSVKNRFKCGS